MSREESMRNHPSYRARIVRDARHRREVEDNFRALAEAEAFMGGPAVPESPEVRQERMDSEAVALANSGRPVRGVWLVAAGQVAGVIGLVLLVLVVSVLADVAGGWLL